MITSPIRRRLRYRIPAAAKVATRPLAYAAFVSDPASFLQVVRCHYWGKPAAARWRALDGGILSLRDRTDLGVAFAAFWHRYQLPPVGVFKPDEVRTIIDAGAHIGVTAAHLACVYPAADVIAIEPVPANAEIARINLKPWVPRVSLVQAALWHEEGQVRFSSGAQSVSGQISEDGGLTSEAVSIRGIAERLGRRIDFLKMDIEGAEWDLLAAQAIRPELVRCLKVELHGGHRDRAAGLLGEVGFSIRRDPYHPAALIATAL